MQRLLGLLLVMGLVGCGGESSPPTAEKTASVDPSVMADDEPVTESSGGRGPDATRLDELQQERLVKLKDMAATISLQSITIEASANDEGTLYGSVGATEIIAALKQNDIHLDIDQIRLDGPLRTLGFYTVKVHVHQEIDADLKVWVIPQSGDEVN